MNKKHLATLAAMVPAKHKGLSAKELFAKNPTNASRLARYIEKYCKELTREIIESQN